MISNCVKFIKATKKIWVAAAGALVLLGAALLILGLVNPTPSSVPVQAGEFEDSIPQERVQELISSTFSEGVQVAGAKAPSKVTHQSPEQTADFTFNALGSIWEVSLPEGDKVMFAVRFREEEGGWSEWQEIEEEDDLKEDPPPGIHYGRLISAGDARHFQYRAVFTLSSAKQVPSVPKIKLTYINSRGKVKPKSRSIGTILRDAVLAIRSFLESDSYEVSANAPSADIPVISRADWGADESYRLDGGGNEIWARSYRPVEKMIVHHTVFSDPDPKAAVRAIYYYHGITLGFGDIGYNFLIDQNGNIYGGRYGGDGVVAGHARRYNWGSVGVAVLGDFRYDEVNNPIRNALDKIAVWKFTKHGVDPALNTHFIDRTLPSIFGHGEVLATLCPGTNLQSYVPKTKEHAHFMPQKVLVKFRSGVSDGQISGFAGRLGLTEVSSHRGNVRRFRFDNTRIVEEVIAVVEGESIVAYARANYIRGVTMTPNDPRFPEQWSLPQIKAPEAWDISPGGDSSVTVAVVDTGVAYESYSDAKGTYAKATDSEGITFVPGYDTINNDAHANDDHGHGTAVASIIAATTNNSYGIAGIAYAVKIMPIKVLSRYGRGTDVTVADGIYWAVDNGAKVLNLSLGGWYSSPILEEAVNYAVREKGAVIVAAAGNSGREQLLYPARYPDVIAVGASDLAGNRTWYSNYGEGLDLLAPGGDTTADLDENETEDGILYETLDIKGPAKDFTKFKFDLGQGTSFAAPHVSGVVALMVSQGTIWPKSLVRYLKFTVGANGVLLADSAVGFATDAPPYPDGVLLRTPSRHQVYYIEGGKKRWIPSPPIFVTRFKWGNILITDEYTLDTYPDGEDYRFADGALLTSNGKVYVMSNEQKRWITNPRVFEGLGYEWEDIRRGTSKALLDSYPTGADIVSASGSHPDGAFITSNGKVYLIESGKKHWIPNPSVFDNTFLRWDWILRVSAAKVNSYPAGANVVYGDGVLLHGSTHHVYLISNGQKRHVAGPRTFNDLGFDWGKIIRVSDSHLNLYPAGQRIY